jgi:hypothetical protein
MQPISSNQFVNSLSIFEKYFLLGYNISSGNLRLIHNTTINKYGGLYGENFSAHLSVVIALQAFCICH